MWCSRRVRPTSNGRIVVGQPWMPPLEQGAEGAVEGSGTGLQQHVGAAPGPLHLLALGEALADHRVDRALGHRRRDGGRRPISAKTYVSVLHAISWVELASAREPAAE